ncbi:MAG: PAS domain-containing sensor histidine kinase [Magnetospirillum sp.]|nr:PAS domain-containing sensor histidine kinase [Magnetospirillum sp.]
MQSFLAEMVAAAAAHAQQLQAAGFLSALPDPVGMAVGAGIMLPFVFSVLAVQQWRTAKLARLVEEKAVAVRRLTGALGSAPDGFYAWLPRGEELCSRRLAILLGLVRGTDSGLAEVLAAFAPADAQRLAQALRSLAGDGDGFELQLALAEGGRRVGAQGLRAVAADGEKLADILWVRDVTEQAAVIEDLARQLAMLVTEARHVRGLLDSLSVPAWLRDDDLSLLVVNKAYAAAVEAPSPDAVVAGQIELASEGLVREARALAARTRAAGEPRSESFHLVLGGQRRMTSLTEVPLSVGDRLLTAGFALDQTQVEEMQAQLDHHITAHAEVLERLATAIAIYSTDTRLTFFNTAFQRLWRLDAEWLSSQPTYGGVMDALRERRLLPEVVDYRAYKEEEIRRFITVIDPVETLLHLPDGRTLRRLISAHPYGGLIFTYEDVTDSLALERSFNTMMAVQRETLDHLHEGLAVFGDDGRLKLWNPAFARIWGLDAADLAGEPHVAEVIDRMKAYFAEGSAGASEWERMRERFLGLIAERRPSEGRLERQDDTILDYAAVPLPDGAMLLAWLDVGDTAKVERALRERNEALAAADLLKNEFIANVSAEVRKPLTSVIGFSEMLSAEYFGPLNARQREYASGITEAAFALQTLFSDILDLAAIEAGRMTLELDTVDVHPLLSSALSLVRERLREKRLALHFDCPLDIGWIVADTLRLKQVMFNLIGNAVQSSPPGGAVTVRAVRSGGKLVLTVSDTGPGIPEAEQSAVFDSFDRGRHREGHGGGLGLALVKRFVELHAGDVDLHSTPGQGTTVTVRLPTEPVNIAAHPMAASDVN